MRSPRPSTARSMVGMRSKDIGEASVGIQGMIVTRECL